MKRVSIIIPCLNEADNMERCLDAIWRQTYPHEAIEILVADGMSTDPTRDIIGRWTQSHDVEVIVIDNPRVIAEFGNAEALKQARGDYVYLMGADEVMAQPDLIEAFIEAFDVLPGIVGVEQAFLKIEGGCMINNYLAVIHINDPLARDIAIKPKQTGILEHHGRTYRGFTFRPGYPSKLFFKREAIESFIGQDTFEEGQVMLHLALSGNNRMAMVDGYGVFHYNVASLKEYLRRCARIALKHTTRIRERDTWVKHTGKRIYGFAFLHLTFVVPFIYSLARAAREREPLWFLHAPIAFLCTFIYGINLVKIRITGKRAW